jgi:hypothetical protein
MAANLAVGAVIITASALLVLRDWRWTIGMFALQYVGVLVLVQLNWPIGMALVKLVVGWMAGAALGLTQVGVMPVSQEEPSWSSTRVFRILSAGLVILVVFFLSPKIAFWLRGIELTQVYGGFGLIGLGLLQIGMTARPLRVVIGLLTILAGFEILYAAVEFSVLVAGLLAAVNLTLAFVGSYLLTTSTEAAG